MARFCALKAIKSALDMIFPIFRSFDHFSWKHCVSLYLRAIVFAGVSDWDQIDDKYASQMILKKSQICPIWSNLWSMIQFSLNLSAPVVVAFVVTFLFHWLIVLF